MKIPNDLTDDRYNTVAFMIRRLCLGERIAIQAVSLWGRLDAEALEHLANHGYALRHSNGLSSTDETYTYVATDRLLSWGHAQGLARRSFDQALAGRDVAKEIRNLTRRAHYDQNTPCPHKIPAAEDVRHRVLIEAQGPLLTTNEDGEVSSPGLTDWYVRQFVTANHLKG